MFSGEFWAATIQRVIRSFAASLLALLTADGTGILDTDWGSRLSTAGMAAITTLLFCVAGGFGPGNGPAFGGVEETTKH